jgi:hypothetical protein
LGLNRGDILSRWRQPPALIERRKGKRVIEG